ncbi:putative zinc- or iron-chelating protein [Geothermobacter ehrlichii]|uniref:Putative zinc-or iron-chelating protein n=1 Tax=Geothermobacter ehrlichii TaxID=213224 RepID=A0A5D3WK30_9BACT|nr:YkgJ family cysteine cluster protein [Geothermobacter ehrlichii]TYO98708.1 putative zinc- or iron-chelating protein [Geothermobacter ehrlichii]
MKNLQAFLDAQLELMQQVDAWFVATARELPADAIACRAGCSACCRGLFDISLIEALILRRAWEGLPADIRRRVRGKALMRLDELKQGWPHWQPPYLLNGMPDEEWTEMPEDDLTPCLLLAEDGRCLVYEVRPMTCRLHGLPAIDLDGTDFGSAVCSRNWLSENFDLRYPYRALFRRENALLRQFALQLTGRPFRELDTFIPLAVLIDFEAIDWRGPLLADPRG